MMNKVSGSGKSLPTSNVSITPYAPHYGDRIIKPNPPPNISVGVYKAPYDAPIPQTIYSESTITTPSPKVKEQIRDNNLISKFNSVNEYIRSPEQITIVENPVEQKTTYTSTPEMPLLPLAVQTSGYWGTERVLYGASANNIKDIGLFAVSDFIALYGFEDWIKQILSNFLGPIDNNILYEYLAYLLSVGGPYLLFDAFMEGQKNKMHLAVGILGSYIVDKMFMKVMEGKGFSLSMGGAPANK